MTSTIEIEIAEEIIIDCAEDAQESNGGYPNLQDSRFWTKLNGYSNYPDAANLIEEEFGYAKVEALVREGYMKAQAKIDNEDELEDLRLQKSAISNLQELRDYLIMEAGELPYLDHDFRDNSMFEDWTSDIPTFGGDEPRDTSETWSWDETHLLVGSCAGDLEIIPRNTNPTRRAIIDKDGLKLSDVQQYLPSNYGAFRRPDGRIQITGRDDHGWTLSGYVIPRLSSGLIPAREFTERLNPKN